MSPSSAQPAGPAAGTVAGLPVDLASLFPEPDGFFARRHRQRRTQLIELLREVLAKALVSGETIRFATRGLRYNGLEFYFAGWAAYYHNQVALIVTDRRLLILQLSRRKPGQLKNQVALQNIRDVRRSSILGRLITFKLADGRSFHVMSLPGADRKVLGQLVAGVQGGPVAGPALEALCPACLAPVPGKVGATLVCPSPTCRVPFRDPHRAAKLSGLVPGLGDLYLGHHFFGSAEFLGSMAALGLGLGFIGSGEPVMIVFALLFLVVLPRAIDYPLTMHMGRKGLVPLALAPAPGAQPRNLPMFPAWTLLLFAAGLALAGLVAWSILSAGPAAVTG
jgi:hypothetical protein